MEKENVNEKSIKREKFNVARLILPVAVWVAGLVVCIIWAPKTVNVNGGVGCGFLLLVVGTILTFAAIYRESYRIGIKTPGFLEGLFPSYPFVDDKDDTDRVLSNYRGALGEFLEGDGVKQNSRLQDYASQILWHNLMLWKKRMDSFGVTLSLDAKRRAYTSEEKAVRSEDYFDGRYDVKEVYEEIDAVRTFKHKGREIQKLHDKEVAHYTLLSAKESEDGQVMCPNCGAYTTRSNLIDGCDYCGTKFSVEDVTNSVSSFGFRRDFAVAESKREAVTDLIFPWVLMITEMPLLYFGFLGAFLYMTESIIARFFTGLLAAFLFGLAGWCLVKLNMLIIVGIIMLIDRKWAKSNRKIIYWSKESQTQEKRMADTVRKTDPLFSIQSFFGGVQNKLMAIHFADRKEQINAFCDGDISDYLGRYGKVIDVDPKALILKSYQMKDTMQVARVSAELLIREFADSKIVTRTELVTMTLEKDGSCKTQAVCAPSVLKCASCGGSLSLMEGKVCEYCGHELDMKKYDWVITDYYGEYLKA